MDVSYSFVSLSSGVGVAGDESRWVELRPVADARGSKVQRRRCLLQLLLSPWNSPLIVILVLLYHRLLDAKDELQVKIC